MALAVVGTSVLAAGSAVFAQSASPGSGQVVETAVPGELCTYDKYNGGVTQIPDLTTATIGFAQSEKEANPFRIAETQSIKDEAAKLGITNLLVTNAQSDLNKEISDIKGMIDQGAQALIISPAQLGGPRSGARLRQGEGRADHDHRPLPDHQDGVLGLHRLGRLELRASRASRRPRR